MSLEKLYFSSRDEHLKFEKNIDYINGYYSHFWKKIHKNITLQYHKNALYFIKGSSFIDSMSVKFGYFHLNKKLYSGKCSILPEKEKKEYGYNVDSDQFCKFIISTIGLVDKCFNIAPKIDKDLVVFRMSSRDDLNNLKIGDYFLENNFSSTSLSPSYPFTFYNTDNKYNNYFEIFVPKNSFGFYFNIKFTQEKNKSIDEYEFILPRETTYKILKKKFIKTKTKKITKFTLLLVNSNFEKYKIKNINQKVNQKLVKKKSNVKINYFKDSFINRACYLIFNLLISLEKLISFHLKNLTKKQFTKSKEKFITYQPIYTNKNFNINSIYKLNKDTNTYRDITTIFNIMNIESFFGNPYFNKTRKPIIILKFINKKNSLYQSDNSNKSIYKLDIRVILKKNNKYKVCRIENILDRYFNNIKLIILENIL